MSRGQRYHRASPGDVQPSYGAWSSGVDAAMTPFPSLTTIRNYWITDGLHWQLYYTQFIKQYQDSQGNWSSPAPLIPPPPGAGPWQSGGPPASMDSDIAAVPSRGLRCLLRDTPVIKNCEVFQCRAVY